MRQPPKEPILRPRHNSLWTDADYLAKLKFRCNITEAGCWEFRGFRHQSRAWKGGSGYGTMSYRCKNWRTNRLAFHLAKGPIPEGHVIRHTCDNQCCCNPDHLLSGTQKENIADCIARGKQQFHPSHHTHCKRGHPYAEHGRNFKGLSGTWRACKACQRASLRRRAGWPEHLLWIPAQKVGQRPDFTGDEGG
jgi:hypothetical protein